MSKKVATNKKPIWFKAKSYGWGWYPSTWQGGVVTLIYVFLLIANYHNFTNPVEYAIKISFLTLILIWICYKTGEKPEWRWGNKK